MIELFFVFFYVGLFTIGGGMVAIPLIQQEVVVRGWLTVSEFTTMIGIAQSTPGPIGINVATYVGFERFGVFGALIATIGFVTPSFLIVSFLAGLLRKYRTHALVVNWFYYIKAAVIGLIGYSLVVVAIDTLSISSAVWELDWKALVFLAVMFFIYWLLRKKPWLVIIVGGVLGVFIWYLFPVWGILT